ERIQVHHDGVRAGGDDFAVRAERLVTLVEQERIDVGEPGLGDDPRIRGTHPQRVHSPDLPKGRNSGQRGEGEQAHRPRPRGPPDQVDPTGRVERNRDRDMSRISPMSATTVIMTTTLGSLKFCPPTTSAAAMLRCAVPSPSTRLVSRSGPPRK